MASPMYQYYGNTRGDLMQQARGAIAQLKKQYADPGAEIQRMLNSGELTQDQFNQYAQAARAMGFR